MKRLKNPKEAAAFRDKLLIEQGGMDPIINKTITDPCLDHQHFGDQQCRKVLQREINSFEGKVANAFSRYVKHLTDDPLPVVLRRLADYLEQDFNQNPIHHTALTIDTAKFKRLPANKQKEILLELGVEPLSNAAQRAAQARKLIKAGKLNMQDHF